MGFFIYHYVDIAFDRGETRYVDRVIAKYAQ